jgi:hypothetical protein
LDKASIVASRTVPAGRRHVTAFATAQQLHTPSGPTCLHPWTPPPARRTPPIPWPHCSAWWRLRGEVTELQAQWEALVEELEAKRRSLSLAEATVELVRQWGERVAQVDEGVTAVDVASTVQDRARAEVSTRASVACTPASVTQADPFPPPQGAGSKRPHTSVAVDGGQDPTRLGLSTALPLSVWQEHLTTWLPLREVVRLRTVCKASFGKPLGTTTQKPYPEVLV